ncbi:class I SAM-dependent methyltransferase [Propylenella binzhouense]|uniref:Class I SAM-dependent rRNA methyltransferase n=1 Tax=Propylenella binzhouense TaxID=2555902 RepID=A0A964WVB5_9HYPH|nr:class I SAM-dependent methyltransferase [Propylenella binzhouense]MYZ49878.1 class I SAM-dependent rRNA methyltransferase [Propylenella binzhouense]
MSDGPSGPLLLTTNGFETYRLLDSGHGRKLERFGDTVLVRPEEQAIWTPRLPEREWEAADAAFTGDTDEEGAGRWRRKPGRPENWTCRHGPLTFCCKLTSFRHVGVFPEQEAHWRYMTERLTNRVHPKVLNLFAYTGLASLVAAEAGARVTHVDASRKAIAWARENQSLSGLEDRPIRWLTEDAPKFAAREVRRGNRYECILLDPPKYGRGPNGEIWDIFRDLPDLLRLCRDLLEPQHGTLILTAYAIRASFLSLEMMVREIFGGPTEAGELVLEEAGGRLLSTSLFVRRSGP